jgi:hypothetical protein
MDRECRVKHAPAADPMCEQRMWTDIDSGAVLALQLARLSMQMLTCRCDSMLPCRGRTCWLAWRSC